MNKLAVKEARIEDQNRTIEYQKSQRKASECETPAFQEANQCYALWMSTQKFVLEVLSPFRDWDLAQKHRDGLQAEIIRRSCDLLIAASEEILRRLYEKPDIINMY